MARTKQTAKKSCGERSTRVKFAIPTKSIVPAPRQIVLKMSKSNIDRHDVVSYLILTINKIVLTTIWTSHSGAVAAATVGKE
jgi:hypothetical protein